MDSLRIELARVGLDIDGPKVSIPTAPRPSDMNGFRSRGVYGNLLSHLSILEGALADNLESVLILEDDAIFRHSFNKMQKDIAESRTQCASVPDNITLSLSAAGITK